MGNANLRELEGDFVAELQMHRVEHVAEDSTPHFADLELSSSLARLSVKPFDGRRRRAAAKPRRGKQRAARERRQPGNYSLSARQ
jgi:hypothetical protein